jgi:hypothetical protein
VAANVLLGSETLSNLCDTVAANTEERTAALVLAD